MDLKWFQGDQVALGHPQRPVKLNHGEYRKYQLR